MSRNMRMLLGILAVSAMGTAILAVSWRYTPGHGSPAPTKMTSSTADAAGPVTELTTESLVIRRGDTLAGLLLRAGADSTAKAAMVAAVEKTFDVRKLRAGSHLTVTRSGPSLASLEYVIDPDHRLEISESGGTFQAAVVDVPGIIHVAPVCATLHRSLFESIEQAGERPELAVQMARIFAWDLDFYTDPREGDEFCILVEKKEYANGQPPTYRRIVAAKYVNSGKTYDAHLFPDEDGKPQYYSSDGRSLQAAFLRSPMRFEARVSSHFSRRRLHPILKIYRPHLGTDYAAPVGTPVQAVAAGRVVFSGRSGGAGNLIKIRHSNGYETEYMHLSRRLVRSGQHVAQGQRIGLVGATGLATGPHLDFRMRRNGRFVDYEHLNFPRATRITAAQREAFTEVRDRFLALMNSATGAGAAILASERSPGDPPSTP